MMLCGPVVEKGAFSGGVDCRRYCAGTAPLSSERLHTRQGQVLDFTRTGPAWLCVHPIKCGGCCREGRVTVRAVLYCSASQAAGA